MDAVRAINDFATHGVTPDLTIYLDVSIEVGRARIVNNARNQNRLDQETMLFHEKTIAGYHEIMKREPERFCVIDADQPLEAVVQATYDALHTFISARYETK